MTEFTHNEKVINIKKEKLLVSLKPPCFGNSVKIAIFTCRYGY